MYLFSLTFLNHKTNRVHTTVFTGGNELTVRNGANEWMERSKHCEILKETLELVPNQTAHKHS